MNFDTFYSKLIAHASTDTTINISGVSKKIAGMSRYTTRNMPDSEYLKIVFHDHSIAVILISDKEIYYANQVIGKLESVKDGEIGQSHVISFQGKDFEPVNKNDYQYVIQKYVGGIDAIEGECLFTDYAPIDGSKAMLSLGIITSTGARADVYCELLDPENIQI